MKNVLQEIYNNWRGLASKAKGSWKSITLVILGALGILTLALAIYVFFVWVFLQGLILMGIEVNDSWRGILGASLVIIMCSIFSSRANQQSDK
jgi:hypothetical protein